MSRASRIARIAALVVVALALGAAAAGVVHVVWHAGLFARRATFPLDLEWMEGGMLVHAQRIAHGQGIYVEPSVEFIPFLYTPLYPALVALLGKVFGIGYTLGRVASLVALAAAGACFVWLAAREGRQPRTVAGGALELPPAAPAWPALVGAGAMGVAGAGALAASYVFTGTFYDLVRADSLLLALELAALATAYVGRRWPSAAAAGVLIALGFFTKQTATIIGAALGLALLVVRLRGGLVYGLAAAATLGIGVAALDAGSDHWFWRYIFQGHKSHGFRHDAAWDLAPKLLWEHAAPLYVALVAVVVGLALARRLRRPDVLLVVSAVAGVAAALIGFGTPWAVANAFIPGVVFPVLAVSVLGARLVAHAAHARRPGSMLTAAMVTVLLGVHLGRVPRPDRALAPSRQDRDAAAQHLAVLSSLPGDGFFPFHPYYPVLVGKRPFVHRMGVLDVAQTYGRPRGLDEAIGGQRFPWIVLDWKSRPGEWRALDAGYHLVYVFRDGVDAVRAFSGAETSPRWIYGPTRAPTRPPGARVLADFENATFAGWTIEGTAFGAAPVPAPSHFGVGYGRYVATSGHGGVAATGRARSALFRLDGDRVRLLLHGNADQALRAELVDGAQVVATASPNGAAEQVVEWDVRARQGRDLQIVLDDQSATGALTVDEVLLLGGSP